MGVAAWGGRAPSLLAAVVNLNHPASYIKWGWLQISTANLLVIVVMLAVFILAIFLPFPGARRGQR